MLSYCIYHYDISNHNYDISNHHYVAKKKKKKLPENEWVLLYESAAVVARDCTFQSNSTSVNPLIKLQGLPFENVITGIK